MKNKLDFSALLFEAVGLIIFIGALISGKIYGDLTKTIIWSIGDGLVIIGIIVSLISDKKRGRSWPTIISKLIVLILLITLLVIFLTLDLKRG